MKELVQAGAWTLLFVLPGHLFSRVKNLLLLPEARPADLTVEAVGWSSAMYFALSLVPPKVLNVYGLLNVAWDKGIGQVLTRDFCRTYVLVLLVAMVSGFLWGRLYPTRLMVLLINRTPCARVWDEFFLSSSRIKRNGYVVHMADGSQWIGQLFRATDTPGSSELWLQDVHWYDNKK